MKKIAKILASFATLAFVVAPAVPANAISVSEDGAVDVANYEEFKEALNNESVKVVNITGDIDASATGKFTLCMMDQSTDCDAARTADVIINGNDHKIIFGEPDNRKWFEGQYFQIYDKDALQETVTINNLRFDAKNIAMGVNGAKVVLGGTTVINGGDYGGIMLQQGVGVTNVPSLSFAANAVLDYANESEQAPSIYIDYKGDDRSKVSDASVKYGGIEVALGMEEKHQNYLFLDKANAPEPNGSTIIALDLGDYLPAEPADPETPDTEDPDTDTPEVTEPVKDEEAPTDEADVTAPNTGTTIANFALVLTGITVAVLTAVYATRFASAKK